MTVHNYMSIIKSTTVRRDHYEATIGISIKPHSKVVVLE
jgi:hypothetical protein